MRDIYDVVVIGGGPGGYTAALYCVRAGLKTILLEKLSAGGQMALSTQIDNYPGFEEGIDGFTLAEKMQAQAERFGAETELADVFGADLTGPVKTVHTSEGDFQGRSVVLAAGAFPRKLGLPEEDSLIGRGISFCAACDGMFYKGKTVAVIGGGDTAAMDALVLSRICEKVIMIHRRDTLKATKVYHEPLMKAKNIEFLWDSEVTGFLYENKLTGLKVHNRKTGRDSELAVDGAFVSIGRVPASELFKDILITDENGYIAADESTRTNIPGVFAVGDIRTKAVRQVVTAASDGAVAAHYAEEYLAEH